jgi:hypothetical protein
MREHCVCSLNFYGMKTGVSIYRVGVGVMVGVGVRVAVPVGPAVGVRVGV